MTTPFPRRVKDLLQLDGESEDEYNTPRKPQQIVSDAAACSNTVLDNKENEMVTNANRNVGVKESMICRGIGNLPKRSSELVILDSDSEEDATHSGNLNCAILNDSFILSPCGDYSSVHKTPDKIKQSDNNLSFLTKFDNMAIDSNRQITSPTNIKSEKVKTRTASQLLPIIVEDKTSSPSDSDIETPMRIPLINITTTISTVTRTASTTSDANFATPQISSYSTSRQPHELGSTQSRKTRASLVNEFRSQKVLFQTPMAISRNIPLSNDSITLSLCDTINDSVETPNTEEKTPLPKQEISAHEKAEKSLENAFLEAEKPVGKVKVPQSVIETRSSASKQTNGSLSHTGPSTSAGSSTVLHINKSEYAIIRKLGCGGSSSVYLAQRTDNCKECALKVVDLHGDPVAIEGYLNETKLLEKLQGNICVVGLYEYQLLRKESKLFMVMEKGDSDLNKILQTYTTKLPLYVLMNFLYQMLQAVNYIHQNGVIHSDLKPANFLMVNGRLKLIDFGIASNIAIDSTSIIKFSQAGTFNYISPEALTDTSTGTSPIRNNQPKIKISTKSDVWSLGCILYLLLYQKTPFSHIKNICAKITAISSPQTTIDYPALPIYYPAMLIQMVKKCLLHDPKMRPSCAELLKYPFNMIIPIQNLCVSENT